MSTPDLDAAIEAAENAVIKAASARLKRRVDIVRPVKPTKAQRTYARAMIANLLEGMDGPESTEIRRRAGLEVES